MFKFYKICLIIAGFLVSASVVFASFNYDSPNNYFLIDSLLKLGGDYILVGDGLSGYCEDSNYIDRAGCQLDGGSTWNEIIKASYCENGDITSQGNCPGLWYSLGQSTDFFGVSNNLIFTGQNSRLRTEDNTRSISVNELLTPAVQVNSETNPFTLTPLGGTGVLNVTGRNKIKIFNDFQIKNNSGLALAKRVKIDEWTIYSDNVYTEEVIRLNGLQLYVKNLTLQINNQSWVDPPDGITLDGVPFCEIKTWNVANDFKMLTKNAGNSFAIFESNYNISGNTAVTCGSNDDADNVKCCSVDYYVYDLDATNGTMICCQAK